jgi:hypothetical protein
VWRPHAFRDHVWILLMVRPYIKTSRPALGPIQRPVQCCLPGVKWLEHEADHSPPSSADVKHEWSYYFYSHYMPSWRGKGKPLLHNLISVFSFSYKIGLLYWKYCSTKGALFWRKVRFSGDHCACIFIYYNSTYSDVPERRMEAFSYYV